MDRLETHASRSFGWPAVVYCLAAAAIPSIAGAQTAKPTPKPPNVLLVLADDVGTGELGCYGHPRHRTPNLDRLAAEGTRFRTCYATPLCGPSRVMLLTGQFGFRTGYFHQSGAPFSPRADSPLHDIAAKPTFAKLLQARGYATALAGKWQLTGRWPTQVRECGFDSHLMWAYAHNLPPGVRYLGKPEAAPNRTARFWQPCLLRDGAVMPTGPEDYGPDLLVDFTLDFVRAARQRGQPFLAYVPMTLAHPPHLPTPVPGQPGRRQPGGLQGSVEYLDFLMGRLLRGLDDAGAAADTVVIFLGDNGTAGRGKGLAMEAGVRVPLIVRSPGGRAGQVSDAVASLADVFPTLADYSQVPLPEGHPLDGASFRPVVEGKAPRHRDWAFSYLGEARLLRDERWLLENDAASARLYDCGDCRDGTAYRRADEYCDGEAFLAGARLRALLGRLPGPRSATGLRQPGDADAKGGDD